MQWAFEAAEFSCLCPFGPACCRWAALSFNMFLFHLRENPLDPTLPVVVLLNFAALLEALCRSIAVEVCEDFKEAFSL